MRKLLVITLSLMALSFMIGGVSAYSPAANYLSDKTIGENDAPVTIIAFMDYDCPFCGRWHQETFPKIKENFIEGGHVKIEFRQFPLQSIHPHAYDAAIASECAAEQGKFFEYIDLLYGSSGDNAELLKSYAEKLSLNMEEFEFCQDNSVVEGYVEADIVVGIKSGVQGTPTFFINGERLSGAQPYENFAKAIMTAGNFEGLPEADSDEDEKYEEKVGDKRIVFNKDPVVEDEDESAEELEARIAELEKRVEEQQSVLDKILSMLKRLFGSDE